eukprot:c17927_g1_i1 orf=310-726(+)
MADLKAASSIHKDCNASCTDLYNVLHIAWRVYCKKACSSDGDSLEECLDECKGLCYKDPVYKQYEWSAPFDRSPGSPAYSLKCEAACKNGCTFKFSEIATNCTVESLIKSLQPPEYARQGHEAAAAPPSVPNIPSTSR